MFTLHSASSSGAALIISACPAAFDAPCLTPCAAVHLHPQLIPVELVSAYKRAMLNIHPGLLPSFGGKGLYGERVHAAVIKSGAR